ncbi:MAG: 4-hydroxythreonine-4-phosphate dehydrogenase PdxA [Alistipes sp.]|jgi:4-hydroxythreonine-4-phosphate dehydrogenase|nr:4-hydroxythreonine-4-phosphate dehydrogenase PdxA [Alistipes sp.]
MANKIKIGITQGDSAGVGWEVILKALADGRMGEMATFVLYGSRTASELYRRTLDEAHGSDGGSDGGMQLQVVSSARHANPKSINLVNIADGRGVDGGSGDAAEAFEPGKPTPSTGSVAVKALRAAVADLRDGSIDALVTAPICKENSVGDNFRFAGHTEFLAAEFPTTIPESTDKSAAGVSGGAVMVMCTSGGLRVALVTSHMALADVPGAISKEKIVGKLRTLRRSLIQDFGVVEPRVAVLALNPHAGEGGLMGTDEVEVIAPAIAEARAEGVLAFGPFAADGLFLSGEYAKYDAILAMYHDQGLAPFKALAPAGVNFTAGLSVVRTSPDHGTAFDIAGRGVANPDSMREAIYAAIDIFRRRAAWGEMTKNPLKHYEREKGDERTIDLSKNEI